jgi:CRISPR-associated protein Cmr5
MSKVDNYLSPALEFWAEKEKELGSLPKRYKGYMASFGTSIIHCGLTPAVFMFSGNNTDKGDEDKSFVVQGVVHVLGINKSVRLFDYVLENDTPATVRRICDAVIALKLALRTFKTSDHA